MAIRCEEEFNPWPSFVDIFSAVILVLMLFLLVTIVNIGYYAQFKYKVQYTGSIVTEDIILQDTSKKVKLEEEKKKENKKKVQIVDQNLMEEEVVQQMQVELQAATDIESAGEDLADKKQTEKSSKQNILEKDKFFYITYEANELFIDQRITEKLKQFIKKAKDKYPGHYINISATDPLDQISITVTKQITLGRTLGVRNLLRKLDYEKKDIKVKLGQTPTVPEDITIDQGVVVVEVYNE
jgi:hypothetical protein